MAATIATVAAVVAETVLVPILCVTETALVTALAAALVAALCVTGAALGAETSPWCCRSKGGGTPPWPCVKQGKVSYSRIIEVPKSSRVSGVFVRGRASRACRASRRAGARQWCRSRAARRAETSGSAARRIGHPVREPKRATTDAGMEPQPATTSAAAGSSRSACRAEV